MAHDYEEDLESEDSDIDIEPEESDEFYEKCVDDIFEEEDSDVFDEDTSDYDEEEDDDFDFDDDDDPLEGDDEDLDVKKNPDWDPYIDWELKWTEYDHNGDLLTKEKKFHTKEDRDEYVRLLKKMKSVRLDKILSIAGPDKRRQINPSTYDTRREELNAWLKSRGKPPIEDDDEDESILHQHYNPCHNPKDITEEQNNFLDKLENNGFIDLFIRDKIVVFYTKGNHIRLNEISNDVISNIRDSNMSIGEKTDLEIKFRRLFLLRKTKAKFVRKHNPCHRGMNPSGRFMIFMILRTYNNNKKKVIAYIVNPKEHSDFLNKFTLDRTTRIYGPGYDDEDIITTTSVFKTKKQAAKIAKKYIDYYIENNGPVDGYEILYRGNKIEVAEGKTTVAILLSKKHFSKEEAEAWLRRNNYKTGWGYETEEFHAYPQMSKKEEEKYSGKIRSKYIKPGLLLKFIPAQYLK